MGMKMMTVQRQTEHKPKTSAVPSVRQSDNFQLKDVLGFLPYAEQIRIKTSLAQLF